LSAGYPAPVLRLAKSQFVAKVQAANQEEEIPAVQSGSRIRILGGVVLSVALISAIYLVAFESRDFFRKSVSNQESLLASKMMDASSSQVYLHEDDAVDRTESFEYTAGLVMLEGVQALPEPYIEFLNETSIHVRALEPDPTWYLYQDREEIIMGSETFPWKIV